jgi:hypothetical protein
MSTCRERLSGLRLRLQSRLTVVALTVLSLLPALAFCQINGGGPNGGGGGGTPGGSNHQVQVNNSGAFGGITNGTTGQVLTSNGASSTPTFQAAGGGSPGSPSGSLQFNLSNVFTGSADFTVDNTNGVLILTGPNGGLLGSVTGQALTLNAGNAITDTTPAVIQLRPGGGSTGAGGSGVAQAGNAVTSGAGGGWQFNGGNAAGTNQGGGPITFGAGSSTGTATAGIVSFSTHGVNRLTLLENGAWNVNGVAGSAGNVLSSNGSTAAPTWGSLSLSALATCAANQILFASSATVGACSSKLTWTDSSATLGLGTPGGSVGIALPNATSGSAGTLNITTGSGTGTGHGGTINITAGSAMGSGQGAFVNITAGNGGTSNPGGGGINFTGGNATSGVNSTGGNVQIQGGQGGGTMQAGGFTISGGNGDPASTGSGGVLNITGGEGGGSGGVGGTITISGGIGTGAQAAGDVDLVGGGNAGTGVSGAVNLLDQNQDNSLRVDGVGHVSYAGSPPAVTACGTSPSLDNFANDTTGTVTPGTGAVASCTITFANPYITWDHCRVSSQTTVASFGYTYTLVHVVITGTSLLGGKFDYSCDGS